MSNPFSHTLRSIQADGFRRAGVALGVGGLVLAAWGAWFLGADLTVYALSREARLEAAARPSALVSENAGRVAAVYAAVGEDVREGQVLVELDVEAALLAVDEARAAQDAVSIRLAALREEIEATEAALAREEAALDQAEAEAEAELDSARARAEQASAELSRTERLFENGHLSASERESRATAAKEREAELRQKTSALAGIRDTRLRGRAEGVARMAALRGQADALQGELEAAWARVSLLELQIERARVRAPADGKLADLLSLPVGAWVDAGATLGTVVPDGALLVVAAFHPADALGRVSAGQRARVRLDGFPWTRYGTLPARVLRVSEEPRDGLIRVELEPEPADGSALPLRHALTGTVEVAVEALSPAELALRAAGRLVAAPSDEAR